MSSTCKTLRANNSSIQFFSIGAGVIVGTILGYVYDNAPIGLLIGAFIGFIAGWLQMKVVEKVCTKVK